MAFFHVFFRLKHKKQIIYTILKKQGTENQIIRLSDNLMKKSSLHFSNTGV